MAIEIKESFRVIAPADTVWSFMKSPENLATCMPGASLASIVDDRRFVGTVKLKIGAITATYEGTMTFVKLDDAARELTLLAEAKEKGGGTVSGTIAASVVALPEGVTEVRCESSTDLTGRIVQVGRGMIEGVAKQVIQKFVANVKGSLESVSAAAPAPGAGATTAAGETAAGTAPAAPAAPPRAIAHEESLNVLAVVWRALVEAVRGFFRRLFGRA